MKRTEANSFVERNLNWKKQRDNKVAYAAY